MADLDIKNYPNIRQSFIITGLIILTYLFNYPLSLIFGKFMDRDVLNFIFYVLSVGIVFLIVYSIRKRKTNVTSINFEIGKNKRIIPLVIIAIIALNFGVMLPIISLIPMPEIVQNVFDNLTGQYGLFFFLLVVVAAPVLEELIFRGIMLDGLLKKYSPIKAILISSILFGLVHLNPWQFITALSFGIFSGWIYYKTKNVSFSIIIHAANNLGAFLLNYFSDSNNSTFKEPLVESYGGIFNLVLILTCSISIIALSIFCLRRWFKEKRLAYSLSSILTLSIYLFLIILPLYLLITNCNNQDRKENISIRLKDSYQKNIENATLMTGWYNITNIDSSFVRQMEKANEFYSINPYPIVTATEITNMVIKENNAGEYVLYMNFGKKGTKLWRLATKKAIGERLAFIVNDKLLIAPYVNAEISNGKSFFYRKDYTKEDLEKIKQEIENNKTEN